MPELYTNARVVCVISCWEREREFHSRLSLVWIFILHIHRRVLELKYIYIKRARASALMHIKKCNLTMNSCVCVSVYVISLNVFSCYYQKTITSHTHTCRYIHTIKSVPHTQPTTTKYKGLFPLPPLLFFFFLLLLYPLSRPFNSIEESAKKLCMKLSC